MDVAPHPDADQSPHLVDLRVAQRGGVFTAVDHRGRCGCRRRLLVHAGILRTHLSYWTCRLMSRTIVDPLRVSDRTSRPNSSGMLYVAITPARPQLLTNVAVVN